MKTSKDLKQLLVDVNIKKGPKFTGLGLVLCADYSKLPMISLKKDDDKLLRTISSYQLLVDFLAKSSNSNSPYHDGFHILNQNFELTHLSQFISPTIVKTVSVRHEFGSRYRTAIYCSLLPGVIACGVLSKNYKATVFVKGKSK